MSRSFINIFIPLFVQKSTVWDMAIKLVRVTEGTRVQFPENENKLMDTNKLFYLFYEVLLKRYNLY